VISTENYPRKDSCGILKFIFRRDLKAEGLPYGTRFGTEFRALIIINFILDSVLSANLFLLTQILQC